MDSATPRLPAGEDIAFSARKTRRTAWFVAAVWAAMTASTLAYVYRHGLTSPWADEMRWVPVIAGRAPGAKWVFKIENQHCLPLVKLVYMGLGRATGFDFRAAALLNAILLAAAAGAMILAVARTRSRASALDVLIPVVLLHWGHYLNLIWGFQLCYVLATALGCLLLLLVSLNGLQLSVARAGLASVCTIAAALCGGPGVFYLRAMAGLACLRRHPKIARPSACRRHDPDPGRPQPAAPGIVASHAVPGPRRCGNRRPRFVRHAAGHPAIPEHEPREVRRRNPSVLRIGRRRTCCTGGGSPVPSVATGAPTAAARQGWDSSFAAPCRPPWESA